MGRAALHISKRVVDGLKPEAKQYIQFDDQLKGFGVCVKPTGTKSYVLQYRDTEARSHRIVIGKVGSLTPDQARSITADKIHGIKKGGDPIRDKRDAATSLTVAELCDWYLNGASAGTITGKGGKKIKASTLAADKSRIDCHIKPLIGSRRVRALTKADITKLQTDIHTGVSAKPKGIGRGAATKGGIGAAARTLTMFKAIMGNAVRHDLITENPARDVQRYAYKKKDRILSKTELKALGQAMRKLAPASPIGVKAVEFLLLTGFRMNEAQGLKCAWIERDERRVRFPDTKSGAQVRVVSGRALALLDEVPRGIMDEFAFPSHQPQKHFVGVPKVLERLCLEAALEGVTPHTLRHTFATTAGEMGKSEPIISGLLGHSSGSVTAGYVHIVDALKTSAEEVSEQLAAALA